MEKSLIRNATSALWNRGRQTTSWLRIFDVFPGGIPPMFKVTNALGENNYFIFEKQEYIFNQQTCIAFCSGPG